MPARSRWRFLVTPRWLAWHAFAILAAWGMLWLGDWQFHRAESGNALSWAYTFEWPIFVIFGVVFWAKTIIDEWRHPGGSKAHLPHTRKLADADHDQLPASAYVAGTAGGLDDESDDPELAAYNAYLAKLSKAHNKREGVSGAL